jgi:peroxiredoxin
MRRALFAVSCAATLTSVRGIAVGDSIPNVGLDSGFPPEKVMMGDFSKGKKVVVVGLPGAFTPT